MTDDQLARQTLLQMAAVASTSAKQFADVEVYGPALKEIADTILGFVSKEDLVQDWANAKNAVDPDTQLRADRQRELHNQIIQRARRR